jgi:hypothetical protein
MEYTILVLWLGFAVAVGMFARYRRSRSGIGWFLLSLIVPPLLTGIFVAILPVRDQPRSVAGKLVFGRD